MTTATDLDLLHTAHRIGQRADEAWTAAAAAAGVENATPRQAVLLAAIADHPGSTQTRLVELTGIDRSTLADMIRLLIKRGLVARRRTKEDARAYDVKLTTAGAEHLATLRAVAQRAVTALDGVGIDRLAVPLPTPAEKPRKPKQPRRTLTDEMRSI